MQLLSHGLTVGLMAGPTMQLRLHEFLKRPEIQHLAWFLIGLAIAGQVITVLSYWVASKTVAERQSAKLGSALKLWFFHLVYVAAVAYGLSLLIPWVLTFDDRWQSYCVLAGLLGLAVVGYFLIPMKVYIISFWRALGLLVLSWIISIGGVFCVRLAAASFFFTPGQAAELRELGGKSPEERRHFYERLAGKDAPDEIDRMLDEALQPIGPRRPLPEREAAAEAIKHQLEERRKTIVPGNAGAIAVFQAQVDRYQRLLEELRAQRGAAANAGR